jgi:hypothetical protein
MAYGCCSSTKASRSSLYFHSHWESARIQRCSAWWMPCYSKLCRSKSRNVSCCLNIKPDPTSGGVG